MSDTRILPISELQYEDMILQGLSKCMKISKKKFNQKQAGLHMKMVNSISENMLVHVCLYVERQVLIRLAEKG